MMGWDDLTLTAILTVENAQSYLTNRRWLVKNAAERASMDAWSKRLDERLNAIRPIEIMYKATPTQAAVAPQDEPIYANLSQELDVTGKRLQQLHEWYDYGQVDSVLRTLDQHLGNFMLAGPHGPGGGKPGR